MARKISENNNEISKISTPKKSSANWRKSTKDNSVRSEDKKNMSAKKESAPKLSAEEKAAKKAADKKAAEQKAAAKKAHDKKAAEEKAAKKAADKKSASSKTEEKKKTVAKKVSAPKSTTEKKPENKKSTTKKSTKSDTKKTDAPKKKSSWSFKKLGGLFLSKMVRGGEKELHANAEEVNQLNVFPVPDGDTGDNMHMTIESGVAAIENMETDNISTVMKAFSQGMLLGARGNSGVIVSQFFAGISKGLQGKKAADPLSFGKALEEGVKQAYSSVMTPTEGTILTVAREAVEYAVSRIDENSTIKTLFADLTKEMHAAVERTPEVLTVLKDAGVVDSGGAGLFYIIDGFNRVINGEQIPGFEEEISPKKNSPKAPFGYAFNQDSVMTFGYCTETLLQLQTSKCDPASFDLDGLKAFLGSIGDSIVAFQTDSIVKIHVHTFTPEKVLEYCRQYGEFLTVKIENMSVQHTEGEKEEKKEDAKEVKSPSSTSAFSYVKISTKPLEKKKYGIVSVSNGAGVEELFMEFGVDVVVEGGQTQNPSTNDFIEAFKTINAETIYVFPNNGNIIMAANQAAELYTDAKICVIPSKNIGTGYVALSAIDFESLTPEDVLIEAAEVMKRVTTGYISPSIRDTEMNGVRIEKGDTIGIIDKEIVLSEKSESEAAHKLAAKLLSDNDKFMLTVFCGQDATEEAREELKAYIAENHPDAEAYFINGEQQIYPFIFAAE